MRHEEHLSLDRLDEVRAGEAPEPECAECRAAVERMRAFAERLAASVRVEGAPPKPAGPSPILRLLRPAAAALLLFALVWLQASARDPRDVDRDGIVDIVDAYRVARAARAGAPQDARLDLDGDGRVTETDALAIAAHAVRIRRRGS